MKKSSLKKLLSPIVITCYLFFSGGAILVSAPNLPVFFTNNINSTGASTELTQMEGKLLELINVATTSIEISIYDFNRISLRDALIAAHNRGVFIRVVTDDEARFHIDSYVPHYLALETAGISIVDDARESDIMHNKFAVFDEQVVWTGSTNWSNNGFTKNHNNSIILTHTAIAQLYIAEFNQMFVDGKFSVHKDAHLTKTFEYNGIPLEFYFSPEDDPVEEMIAEVNTAEQEILFSIFFFTHDGLRDALITAKQRGVKLRGIWDSLGAGSGFSEDELLCAANIPVKIENTIGKMHNKVMVLDPSGTDPRVVTGSMNWSAAGSKKNDENTVIIHDGTVAQEYANEFNTFYDALPAELACVTETISQTVIYLPLINSLVDPTPVPTETPIPTVTPTPAPMSDIQLVRMVYNPEGDDVEGELVEITNSGTISQDMTGWTLQDEAENTFTFPVFILEPQGSIILWVRAGINDASNLFWGRGSAVWNNGGDIAVLSNSINQIIDSCVYEGGATETSCQN